MGKYRAIILLFLLFMVGISSVPAASICPQAVTTAQSDDSLSRQRAFDYFYLQALSLKEQEAHDAALEMFEHCLALNPSSPAVIFELSNYYMFLGKKNEALGLMQQAVKMEPGNFWYRQILASAYEDNGRRDDAIAVYESMAADFPTNTEMYLVLAGYYSEESLYDKALAALENYERKEGKSEQISMQKYNICVMMDDTLRAIAEVNKLVADNPDDLRYRVLLGDIYMHNGNPARAEKIYRQVLSQEPDNVNGRLAIVNLHKSEGNDSLFRMEFDSLLMNRKISPSARAELLTKALPELAKSSDDSIYIDNLFKRAMQLPGNQLPTTLLYAQYLSIVGAEESDITPVLEKVLSVEPENKAAQLQLLAYAIKHENYDEIIARADTAILYNPEMLQLYYYRGLAYFLKDMPDEALATYRRGLQSRSEESDAKLVSDIFALIGDTEHELGNRSATMAAYDSALIYNPHNVQVLNNYAYYLAVDGENLERAEEMSLKTVKENPDNPIYIDTYMWVLFKQGRHEEAKAYAEKLLATNDDMSAVEYSHCGDIFAVCGDTERAVELWSEAQLKGDDSKILKRKIKKKRYIPDEKRKKDK